MSGPMHGRVAHGEQHYRTHLTRDQVLEIRALTRKRSDLLAEIELVSNVAIGEKFEIHANSISRIASGRTHRFGAALSKAGLTAHDVSLIRALIAERKRLENEARELSDVAIGRRFGVSAQTVQNIRARRSWDYLQDDACVDVEGADNADPA